MEKDWEIVHLDDFFLWKSTFFDWPFVDLRGLISPDNKTKRVNVLIVADGAGILGKCVKLVFTSGPYSSPPCYALPAPFSLLLFTPQSFSLSLIPHAPLDSSCDTVSCFHLFLYIQTDMSSNDKSMDVTVEVEWIHPSFTDQRKHILTIDKLNLNSYFIFDWFSCWVWVSVRLLRSDEIKELPTGLQGGKRITNTYMPLFHLVF